MARKSDESDIFIDLKLIKFCGTRSSLPELHGYLIHVAGKSKEYVRCMQRGNPIALMECQISHADLAKALGLRDSRYVGKMLRELRRLRLVEWKRGKDFNTYRIFRPDYEWIAMQARKRGIA